MEGLHLFITADTEAEIDVDVLAVAFNMNKTDFLSKVTVIDEFESPDIQAVLVDEDWFMCYDNNIEMTNIYNPKGLYWNYFYHVWQTLSCSTLENAVVFSTNDAPTDVLTIDPKTATVVKGQTKQFTSSVSGSTFSIVTTGVDAGTTINTSGLLTVSATETKTSITVKAEKDGMSDTAVVTVTP